MDIEEIKYRKEALEETILKLLLDFQEETDMIIKQATAEIEIWECNGVMMPAAHFQFLISIADPFKNKTT